MGGEGGTFYGIGLFNIAVIGDNNAGTRDSNSTRIEFTEVIGVGGDGDAYDGSDPDGGAVGEA